MISLTRKTDYALVALAKLAEAETVQDRPVSVRQIAEEYRLPLPLLMNVFKGLQKAGFVRSTRGAHGGYDLAKSPDRIKLLSVIEVMEGPVRLALCCEEGEREDILEPCISCQALERCPISTSMRKVNDRIIDFLGAVTLEDLMGCKIDVFVSNVGTVTQEVDSQTNQELNRRKDPGVRV